MYCVAIVPGGTKGGVSPLAGKRCVSNHACCFAGRWRSAYDSDQWAKSTTCCGKPLVSKVQKSHKHEHDLWRIHKFSSYIDTMRNIYTRLRNETFCISSPSGSVVLSNDKGHCREFKDVDVHLWWWRPKKYLSKTILDMVGDGPRKIFFSWSPCPYRSIPYLRLVRYSEGGKARAETQNPCVRRYMGGGVIEHESYF
jgi:hypothetical protein